MFKDEGRDLSPITDKLWKKFFEKQFGTNSTNKVVKRMKEKKVSFKWIQLYEAKGKEMAQVENEALDRIKQLYKKEDARKQSRQVRPCTKVPPSSKRRFCGDNGPGYNVANVKSNIKEKLVEQGISVQSYNGGLLYEPWEIYTESGRAFLPSTLFGRNACTSKWMLFQLFLRGN